LNPVLIDSDVLIEVTRGRDQAILDRWDQLSRSETPLFCSPVSVAELWHGALPKEHATLDALFVVIECLPIDSTLGRRAGGYLQQFAKSHHLELGDAVIAATASIHGLRLWTRNRRYYPMADISFY